MTRQTRWSIWMVGAVLTLVLSACSLQPTDLPLPGTRAHGPTMTLRVEFASVLNLPARSKVLLNGARVGVLRGVSLGDDDGNRVAVATLDIDAGVRIPSDTTAELTQATLLGDFYIALASSSTTSRQALADNAVIGTDRSRVSPQVEELLGGVAALSNGGTVATLQRVIDEANAAFPADPADRDVGIEVLRALIARTANADRDVASIIDSIAAISDTLDTNAAALGFSFEFGPRRVSGAVSAFLGLSNVLNALGPNVVPIGDLITPRYPTLVGLIDVIDPLVATAVRLDSSVPLDIARLGDLLDDRIIPFLAAPRIDIVDVTRPDGRAGSASTVDTRAVATVLRMIGAMR